MFENLRFYKGNIKFSDKTKLEDIKNLIDYIKQKFRLEYQTKGSNNKSFSCHVELSLNEGTKELTIIEPNTPSGYNQLSPYSGDFF